jgi:hypothetical protein
MTNATRVVVSAFGVLFGLAGIEHGLGEILQGNKAPDAIVFASWPDSALFGILAGEPAMTIVPNLLLTGILAILASLAFLVWVTLFIRRKHGGLVLIALSIVLLLVGGGFGPPVMGILLGLVATRIDAPLKWWRAHLSRGARHVLGALWPWSFVAGLLAWLFLMPGTMVLDYFVGVDNPDLLVPLAFFLALGFLLLTVFAGFARDLQRPTDRRQAPSMGA